MLTWQDMSSNTKATGILLAAIVAFVVLFYLAGKFPALMVGLFLLVLFSTFISILWLIIRNCING